MIKIITQAAQNFLNNDLELLTVHSDKPVDRGYISLITATTIKDKHEVYISCCSDFLRVISDVMLFDDNPDHETMDDLNKELNNIIIGSAKVLAEQQDLASFNISTPVSLGEKKFDIPYDSTATLSIDDKRLTIAIKKLID